MTAGPQHATSRSAIVAGRPPRSGRHHRPAGRSIPWKGAAVLALLLAAAVTAVITTGRAGDPARTAGGPPAAAKAAAVSALPSNSTAPTSISAGTSLGSTPTETPPASGAAAAAPVATGCAGADPLTVAAAPAFAAFLQSELGAEVGGCAVRVVAQEPADLVAGGSGTGAPALPDVWIPDSSLWLERARAAGLPVSAGPVPVVASSAVVLALAPGTAARLAAGTPDLGRVLDTRTTATPIRIGLPDPLRSVPSAGVLLALDTLDPTVPADRAAMTWGARSGPAGLPVPADRLLAGLAADPDTAVPVTEQALWTYNRSPVGAAAPATPVYGVSDGLSVDYPFVVLEDRPAVAVLLAVLQSERTREALAAAGFRDGTGAAAGPLAAVGVPPTVGTVVPPVAAVDAAVAALHTLDGSTRMLAVLDVSGSMANTVPGAGGATRLDLAKAAASRGLGLYPADSEVGLWIFSRNLTADSDHRELAPVAPLGAGADGVPGAQRIATAIDSVQVDADGDTGLYDTTLDAVRAVRAQWDPTRYNVVLILSDGQNDDPGSMSLPQLVDTLHAEADPGRPVAVVTIALGPDSDVAALSQISVATGGAGYVAVDPRDIMDIFLDSVGRRLCAPGC